MLAPPRKRHRSPSPPPSTTVNLDGITSPLDVLLKRRRRAHHHGHLADSTDYQEYPAYLPHPAGLRHHQQAYQPAYGSADGAHGGVEGEVEDGLNGESSGMAMTRFVEKRRMRQWERLNNPNNHTQGNGHGLSASQPLPSAGSPLGIMAGHDASWDNDMRSQEGYEGRSSPVRPKWFSQPTPVKGNIMSSSPIRHHPPTSSPFRPTSSQFNLHPPVLATNSGSPGSHRGNHLHDSTMVHVGDETLRHSGTVTDDEDDAMDEDEMKREWGPEYFAQNSLLHQLHMARSISYNEGLSMATPDQTILQTPSLHSGPSVPSPYGPPSSHVTPYRQSDSTSYFPDSSPFPQQGTYGQGGYNETPFRDFRHHPPSSSPFPSQTQTRYSDSSLSNPSNSQRTPARGIIGYGGDGCNVTPEQGQGKGQQEAEEEVRRRYEEANRLLAELEVVRRQRWGEGS